MNAPIRPGVLLAHKPVGVSSYAMVAALMGEIATAGGRKRLRICHGGALDPFASGLLLILAGPMTRVMDTLHTLPKRYVVQVRWGEETDTGDLLGTSVRRGDATALRPAVLDAAVVPFLGWTDQIPPNTSNKRIGGERAYEKAHRGEQFELPACRVYLHSARWVRHDLPATSTVELVCRGGYYVRSFVRDLGRSLGVPAHVGALARTEIGPWADPGEGRRRQYSGSDAFGWCSERLISATEAASIRRREAIPLGHTTAARWTPDVGYSAFAETICAIHGDRPMALLRREADTLVGGVIVEGV